MTTYGEDASESLYIYLQKRKMNVQNGVDKNNFLIVLNDFIPTTTDLAEVHK